MRVSSPPCARAVSACLAAVLLVLTGAPAWAGAASPAPIGGPRLASGGVVADLPPGAARPPEVDAASYVVSDADTGQILAAKAPHVRFPPASTLKTLTALTVFDHLDEDQVYTAVQDDANVDGSRVGIVPHGTYTVRNLWEGLFLRSGNDAATALANANGGTAKTVREMNVLARDLQAGDTLALNPTGLDEDGQLSSAYDLGLLGRAVLRQPGLMHYTGLVKSQFPGKPVAAGKPRSHFEIYTEQRYVLNYDGALGIKNGYTTKARNTLVAAATRGDRTVLVTLMKASGSAWKQAAALSDWGFAEAERVGSVGQLVEPLSAQPTTASAAAAPLVGAPLATAPLATAPLAGAPLAGADRAALVADTGPTRSGVIPTVGVVTGLIALAVAGLRARVRLRRRRRRRTRVGLSR